MPKISVIVPVYNVEKYMARCIDSILNQTFTDFELIIVDDGSSDNSGMICDEYVEKDNRIKVIHKENGGLSDARNCGFENSCGEFVSFIDSDDWIEDAFLETLYENAIKNEADVSIVNLHRVYDDRSESPKKIDEGLYTSEEVMKMLYKTGLGTYLNVACNKLYRRSIFGNTRYPKGRLHEDGFTTYKLIYNANRIYMSNEDLYCYYQRSSSIMNQKFSINRVDEYWVYKERSIFFKENDMHDLFIQNEKTRFACIKSLTIKIIKSDISEKNKLFKIFQEDVKKNMSTITLGCTKKEMLIVKLYYFSPILFCYFFKIKNIILKIGRRNLLIN